MRKCAGECLQTFASTGNSPIIVFVLEGLLRYNDTQANYCPHGLAKRLRSRGCAARINSRRSMNGELEKEWKKLRILALFTFVIAPVLAWIAIGMCDETAVYASLSRMLWYKGNFVLVFVAILAIFIPMLLSLIFALELENLPKKQKRSGKVFFIVSCVVLYIGAIILQPSDGINPMSVANVLHGVLSFGGIALVFLSFCKYERFITKHDPKGALLLRWILAFTLVSGLFAVFNVYDKASYVIASGISELYILMMLNVISLLSYYLALRNASEQAE